MKKNKVIDYKNLPPAFPTISLVLFYMLYLTKQANPYLMGAFGTLLSLKVLVFVYKKMTTEIQDIFEEEK